MPALLPGMDPYLENDQVWALFRRQLVAGMYQTILPGLVDRYRARVNSRKFTSEFILFTTIEREDHEEEHIEIRSRTDGKLVTLLDITSPANRTKPAGRAAFLDTRAAAVAEKAAYVEIDLITQGRPCLDFDRSTLPQHDYTVTVTRGGAPDRYEIYTSGVRKRLPKFKLPLATDDRDTVVDLQLLFTKAYEQGGFEKLIAYHDPLPPDVKLSTEDRDWVLQQVRPNSGK